MSEEPAKYHVDDEGLARMLHQLLVVEGEPEVEIVHPVDGPRIVTRAQYDQLTAHLARAKGMSPAVRLVESKRIERQKQMKFRTMLIDAQVCTVDVDDTENFGKDAEGNEMPISGLLFALVDQYPDGTEKMELELGCFFDEQLLKPPVRILRLDPSLSPNEAVETNERSTE